MLIFSCSESDWQLSSPAQVCTSSFPPVYMVEHFYVDEDRFSKQYWQNAIDNTQWLEIFQPFTAVRNLYLSKKFVSCIATTLQDLSEERVTEVLPTLESLFFGRVSAIRTYPGSPWKVCCRATALRSPYNSFSMGQDGARRVILG
jgi:hypothetical protein